MIDSPSDSDSDMARALAGQHKGRYVAQMFGRIAARYDLMNRLMSLGQDRVWRRRMASMAQAPPHALVLDLATGTGDVALAVLEQYPDARVVGADFALPMLAVGQCKIEASASLHFVAADALALPHADARFDVVLHAFLMRNIEDIPAGFREQWRVLKPGGRVVCLEIVGPSSAPIRAAYRLFFEQFVPRLGARLSGQTDAYHYLPQSVLRFPPPETLSQIMRDAGFQRIRHERAMFGSIAIHVAQKPHAA